MNRARASTRARGGRRRALTCVGMCAALSLVSLVGAQDAAAPAPSAPEPAKAAPSGPPPGEGSHVVREGDTLWDLSGKHMGSSYDWPRLWSYNPEITNPHWIYPGHVLRLREGAEGGYSTALAEGAGEGGQQGAQKARFGSGFGAMFNRNARRQTGMLLIGEEVYLDKDALAQAARIVGSPEEQMLLAPSDQVYLQFGKDLTPSQGKELTVFVRLHRKEVSPKAGKVRAYEPGEAGEIVRVLGALKIDSFDEENRIARATITEALDPIERGFEVTDVPRRLAQVAPKTNATKVEAKIIASNRPLGTLGQSQIAFIDAGTKQGVEVGNRFFVVRQGDAWRKHLTLREDLSGADRPDPSPPADKEYPWEVVAEARVLYVRPESSTAVITGSVVDVGPGDVVEMREGY